jgi:hypothetical protein
LDTIIGLGTAGCNVARSFSAFPQYKVYLIDSKESDEKKYFRVQPQDSPELYESSCPSVKRFLARITKDVLFVVNGASDISAITLSILQQIHHKSNINVLYVQPDASLLNEKKRLLERTVRHVLQEYTRSGVFEKMFLVSNDSVEGCMQEVPLRNYYGELNQMISATFHGINVFNHIDSVTDTFSGPAIGNRICTIGLLDPTTGEEKMFFPLDSPNETRYYYGMSEKQIDEDKTLRKKIITQIKGKNINKNKISYGIYSTEYDTNYGYVVSYSSQIQLDIK